MISDGTTYIKTEGNDSLQLDEPMNEAQHLLDTFWQRCLQDCISLNPNTDFKVQELPLARIKKIMKLDEDVKMISAEAPIMFAKACELFVAELTTRAWVHTEESKRRTLQKNDIALAVSKYDMFDFLIDIVPREEIKPAAKRASTPGADQVQYLVQFPASALNGSGSGQPITLNLGGQQIVINTQQHEENEQQQQQQHQQQHGIAMQNGQQIMYTSEDGSQQTLTHPDGLPVILQSQQLTNAYYTTHEAD